MFGPRWNDRRKGWRRLKCRRVSRYYDLATPFFLLFIFAVNYWTFFGSH